MRQNYSFLKDEFAMLEIRKHKWIESEKLGREIGFATAAMDWIKSYGNDWLRESLKYSKNDDFFSEKRRFRRFSHKFPILLSSDNSKIQSYTNDINFIALRCTAPKDLAKRDAIINTTIDLSDDYESNSASVFNFTSRIIRVSPTTKRKPKTFCNIVLSFNEQIRDFLRGHANMLSYSSMLKK